MKTTLRSDRRVHPQEVEYRLLTFEECKALHGHCSILDRNGKIATVLITSVKTWKTRPDEVEVHCKFGMYEYFVVRIIKDIADNTELVKIVEQETEESISNQKSSLLRQLQRGVLSQEDYDKAMDRLEGLS